MKIVNTKVILQFDLEDDIEFNEDLVQGQIEIINHVLSEIISWSQPQIMLPSKEERETSIIKFK